MRPRSCLGLGLLLLASALFGISCGGAGDTTATTADESPHGIDDKDAPPDASADSADRNSEAAGRASEDPPPVGSPPQTAESDGADSEEPGGLPTVDVMSVPDGSTVDLASFSPSATPLVLWFWAPH